MTCSVEPKPATKDRRTTLGAGAMTVAPPLGGPTAAPTPVATPAPGASALPAFAVTGPHVAPFSDETVVVTWEESAGADSYAIDICADADPTCAHPLASDAAKAGSYTHPALVPGAYRACVAALDAEGQKTPASNNCLAFLVKLRPPPPGPAAFSLTAPSNRVLDTAAPVAKFQRSANATAYHVRLGQDADAACVTPVVDLKVAQTDADTPEVTVPLPGLTPHLYHLCVTATDDHGQSLAAANDGLQFVLAHLPTSAERQAPLLSQTGLYSDISTLQIAAENLPFTPQFPLYSDGAHKRRWLFLPAGQKIDTGNMDDWVFPPGTVLWKEFKGDSGKLVETRMLVKTGSGAGGGTNWFWTTYVWRDDQSDADQVTAGATKADAIQAGSTYSVPTQAQCSTCHQGSADFVLGFTALQLSGAATFPVGMLTLPQLATAGMITVPPAAQPVIAGSAADQAALGYLHGNCGHCHNGTTGFCKGASTMRLRHLLAPVAATLAAEPGYATTYGMSSRVLKGNAAGSTIISKMTTKNMPLIGADVSDAAALTSLSAWINALP